MLQKSAIFYLKRSRNSIFFLNITKSCTYNKTNYDVLRMYVMLFGIIRLIAGTRLKECRGFRKSEKKTNAI